MCLLFHAESFEGIFLLVECWGQAVTTCISFARDIIDSVLNAKVALSGLAEAAAWKTYGPSDTIFIGVLTLFTCTTGALRCQQATLVTSTFLLFAPCNFSPFFSQLGKSLQLAF